MPQNKPLAGEVVKVELTHLEGEERRPCTEVTIQIAHRAYPYRPTNYTRDWSALQDQQQPFNEYDLKAFARYEKEKEEWDAFQVQLWTLHLGGVEIFQED